MRKKSENRNTMDTSSANDANANVDVNLESVSPTDKESDKLTPETDDVKPSTDDAYEPTTVERVNNGDIDEKVDATILPNESATSPSKGVISVDSNASPNTCDQPITDKSVSNKEDIEADAEPISGDNAASNTTTTTADNNDDDDNLMEEIHSGGFNATSSPIRKIAVNPVNLNESAASVENVDDSLEIVEPAEEEEFDEEQDDVEEEEEDGKDEGNDTIVLDDDDDDDDDVEEEDEEEDVVSEEDTSSFDDNESDVTEKGDYRGGNKDDDVSTLSSDDGDDVQPVAKEPARKPTVVQRRKTVYYKKLVQRSVKM